MTNRPILGSSCARATTAAEMRFRIDQPIRGRRGARVVALDRGAEVIIASIARHGWGHARFFAVAGGGAPRSNGGSGDLVLRDIDGQVSRLADELAEADVVVIVATTESDCSAAGIIGAACTASGIMTAGLVIGEPNAVSATATALRPHARVLMTTEDEHDVVEVLTALRV